MSDFTYWQNPHFLYVKLIASINVIANFCQILIQPINVINRID